MGVEILDETDHFADNEQTLEVNEDMRIKVRIGLSAGLSVDADRLLARTRMG